MTLLRHLHRPFVAPFALAFAMALPGSPASAHPSHAEPIAAARHQALGSTVTVRGTVTVQSNAFDPGFAIQQGASGIYILEAASSARTPGEEVEVTGTLVDSFGLLAIQPTSITAHGRGQHIQPRKLSTGSIGEATEGRMFTLEGDMVGDVVDDGPFGFKLEIDDGSGAVQLFIYPGTGITTAGLHDGVSIKVVCFSNQFDTHYECDPRSPADLEID